MANVKFNAFLEELRASAVKIGGTQNIGFTAETFIVAILDNHLKEIEVSDPMEQKFLVDSLKDYFGDINAARQILFKHIFLCDEATAETGRAYMNRRAEEAYDVVRELEMSEVSAYALLCCVLHSPNKALLTTRAKTMDFSEPPKFTDRRANLEKLFSEPEERASKNILTALVADTKRIRKELCEKVLGQDNAINVFATGYYRANVMPMLDDSGERPKATFLFAGPPGVGKTFLAKSVAKSLHLPFRRFDMSEYADDEANLEFCGFAKTYKASKPGNVTDYVKENPKCVLLFDEIEKAHMCIIHLFLQMLDAGRVKDNYWNEEISFKDAIVIMTTNAGKQLYNEYEGDLSALSRKVVIKSLEKDINPQTHEPYFPAAICSRFASGNVVMFNHIDAHILREIARMNIVGSAEKFSEQMDIGIKIDERVFTALLFAEGSAADARTISGRAEAFFNNELYELFRLVSSEKTKTEITDIENITIELDLSEEDEYVRKLFASDEKSKILVFADDETVGLFSEASDCAEIIGVSEKEKAIEIIKEQGIASIFIDLRFGAEAAFDGLNIEDIDSSARDFFKFLTDAKDKTPVYILETENALLTDEEKTTLVREGIRGVVNVSDTNGLEKRVRDIVSALYQQKSMERLARENKVVSYETVQSISEDGKQAVIRLFDFKTSVAVDSEDFKNVLSAVSKPNVRFDDVIGARDAKDELLGFVDYLKAPKKYMGTGVKAPKGILLYGPPGTGKTMLAKAMACEADVTFIAAEGNQFLKRYQGEGSDAVHDLFRTARKYAPSILFIDEIDAIAKERNGMGNGDEQTLTAFLTEMDGFVNDPTRPVFVLAATNFDVEPGTSKSLDPALMRRFDRRVFIDLPDKEERIRYMKKKTSSNKTFEISDGLIENISLRSTGMSLAELDSVLELALRSAIRTGSTKVTDGIFEEAFETFNGGEIKKWDPSTLERVARHEAGHALISTLSGEKPSYLTIVARGDHGGYMLSGEENIKEIYTKEDLLSRIRTSLGGRAAEIVCYGDKDGISTGASGDLVNATSMARRIVCQMGMDEEFGLAVIGQEISSGADLGENVRKAVNDILTEQMELAVKLVSENRDKLDSLVGALMVKNHLTRDEIQKAIYG